MIVSFQHEHDWVTDRLALGSAVLTRDEVRKLRGERVSHVIDCTETDRARDLYAGTGVHRLHCPAHDDGQPKSADWFHRGVQAAMDTLARPRRRILVHCLAGVNRSSSMLYAILRATGLPPGVAEVMIRRARPIVGLAYKADADAYIEAHWLASHWEPEV